MITIKIDGIDAVKRALAQNAKQARYAAARALTYTARDVKQDLKAAMRASLPGSSPYTANAQYSTTAMKDRLEAMVGVKDIKPARGSSPAMLVKEHFTGGLRGNKPMEKAMNALGAMPSGWRVVPGKGMPLDAFGNPKRTSVAEVVGALRSGMLQFKGKGKKLSAHGYFVAPVTGSPHTAHLQPGIYRRIARAGQSVIVPVFVFIRAASYRKVIDLEKIARTRVERDFAGVFKLEFAAAMRTAK